MGTDGTVKDAIEVLDAAKSLGLTVIRTWAFNDGSGWNAFQPQPGTQQCGSSMLLGRASMALHFVLHPHITNT